MGKSSRALCKTVFQIRFLGGHVLDKVRMYAKYDALMYRLVNLCEIMAFVLVYHKKIPRFDGVELIVNQKLFTAGYGVIYFITVMDMHVHGLFILIEMGDSKILVPGGCFHCGFTGIQIYHGAVLLRCFDKSIAEMFRICKI